MSAMKRKPVQQKSQIRWKRKVLAALLVLLCFASLVLMETQYPQVVSLSSLRHRFIFKPKIAFLFIARNRLPLDMVWDAFFKVLQLIYLIIPEFSKSCLIWMLCSLLYYVSNLSICG